MITRIKVHNSEFIEAESILVAELHVRHLLGEHYEVWRGSPWHWRRSRAEISDNPSGKRRRVLNREYKRKLREVVKP